MQDNVGIIIVDHGSERPEANAMLDEVVRMFHELSGYAIVEAAHMELAPPSIAEAFARCVEQGARHVVVHPYMLAPGRHSTDDIPRIVAEAAEAHPGVTFSITEPLGVDARIGEVIDARVRATLGEQD